ncbi:I78 family peptidase inhibitor [Acerihabitans sp.]|uniref:I78 family peptidase inhibitor n=1 Tax=Acerihabitans sp. TaxID=2811394 RepID=UPI002EDAA5FC
MRITPLLTLFFAFTLSACSGAEKPSSPQNAAKPLPVDDTCMSTGFRNLIGKPVTVLDGMRFSMPMRLIKPGQGVTMDYNPKRLNFTANEQGIITGLHCS